MCSARVTKLHKSSCRTREILKNEYYFPERNKMTVKQLEVSVKIGETAEPFIGKGQVELFETSNDVLNAMQDAEKAAELIDLINFAIEQKERSSIRQKVVQENGAEERAFESAVKNLMSNREKLKKPVTREVAEQLIRTALGM